MEVSNANPDCAKPYICNIDNVANAEDAPSYTDNNYNMGGYGTDNDENKNDYYGFNPELVCMQYQLCLSFII